MVFTLPAVPSGTQVSLRFKTEANSGVLCAVLPPAGESGRATALVLNNGQLVLMNDNDGGVQHTTLELSDASDSNWHFVIVTLDGNR